MSTTLFTLPSLKEWLAQNEPKLLPTTPLCFGGELGISIRIEASNIAIDAPDFQAIDEACDEQLRTV
ncbi:TPA: hypothetical protein ACSQ1O_002256 [Aeromonas hydrophila]